MIEYKRFVSYLYGYDENEKINNAGFAKVESRDGRCKISIHMRGVFCGQSEPCRIFLFVRNGLEPVGLLIGSVIPAGGSIEQKYVTDSLHIQNTDYTFEDLCGVIVKTPGGRCYATAWDDKPLLLNQFMELNLNQTELKAAEVSPEPDQEQEPVQRIEGSAEVRKEPESEKKVENQPAQEPVSQCSKQNRCPGKTCVNETPRGPYCNIPERFLNPYERWEKLRQNHVAIRPFEQDNIQECIRIHPADIAKLQKKEWPLASNSFLLHGYYNYHYLILGKREKDGVREIYLGVPGVYFNQEKNMASMFGFMEFQTSRCSKLKAGMFGFWLRKVEI